MKSISAVGLVLFFVSLSSLAQTGTQPQFASQPKSILVLDLQTSASSCPISMRVRQGTGNGLLIVKHGKQSDAPGSHLRLNLAPSNGHPGNIVAATVIVHGFNGKPGVFPLVATRDHASEITRTLTVPLTADDDNSFWSELLVPGLTAPNRVDLQSVTYADGSIWRVTALDACRAVPDPFMLVAAQ